MLFVAAIVTIFVVGLIAFGVSQSAELNAAQTVEVKDNYLDFVKRNAKEGQEIWTIGLYAQDDLWPRKRRPLNSAGLRMRLYRTNLRAVGGRQVSVGTSNFLNRHGVSAEGFLALRDRHVASNASTAPIAPRC